MDFLEANKEAIEREIFFRVADLLNLDVEVIFYDTTSLHFEIDEEDRGRRCRGPDARQSRGRATSATPRRASAAIRRTAAAMRRRSSSVWRSPARASRCATGCSRATRSMSPRWRRSRRTCAAGSSRAVCSWAMPAWSRRRTSRRWPRGGGKYLMACRCAAGDEVTEAVLARPGRYQHGRREPAGQGGDGRRRRAATPLRGVLQPAGGGAPEGAPRAAPRPSSRRNSRACARLPDSECTASGSARCAPAPATGAT